MPSVPYSVTDPGKAAEIMPAWFIKKMMADNWRFGLLLVNGRTLVIETIDAIHQAADGSIWLDVRMLQKRAVGGIEAWPALNLLGAMADHQKATVNAAQIVMAFEFADED